MIERISKKYAMTEKGARDYVSAVFWSVLVNISKMLPVGVLAGVKGLNEDVLKEAGQAIEAGEETQKEESAQKQADGRLQREVPENDSSRKMDFSDEMAIMAGFSSAQIDAFIHALRKKGVGRIDYKAVLTPYNMKWDSVQLYEEIKKEHEMMTGKGKDEAL
mgnify:CR=1 FL=1